MIEPFLIRAIIAGIGVAIITGAIGCFVVWRKMAYFGDSLAHSALLGVALGLVLGISTNLGTMIICSVFAILLIWLNNKKSISNRYAVGYSCTCGSFDWHGNAKSNGKKRRSSFIFIRGHTRSNKT